METDQTPDDSAERNDGGFETDLAKLAARFAAQSGGGLSPELSTDLALQIVLNEIVEQACLATGATGAAVVLHHEGEMVCRASSGSTAPELGARLDTSSGISGECVKTRLTQRCDDVTQDPRADLQASSRLGIRSVMVMPLLKGSELVGLFEVFSSRVGAFGDRDQLTLEALALRVLSNVERAAKSVVADASVRNLEAEEEQAVPSPSRGAGAQFAELLPAQRRGRGIAILTWASGLALLLGSVWMGARVLQHLGWRRVAVYPRSAPSVAKNAQGVARPQIPAATAVVATANASSAGAAISSKDRSSRNTSSAAQVPTGGLSVSENGREVFRMVPPAGLVQNAAALEPDGALEVPPAEADQILLSRVEPEYPEQAREQQIQGAVVLELRIGKDGVVQAVKRVSGDPLLAQAAEDAVRQWRFKPRAVDGHHVEMQTRVTLNFRLPQ